MTRFDDCLKFILDSEGGYSDDPSDHGGPTQAGVLQSTYDTYRRKGNLPLQPVKFITHDEIGSIYRDLYFRPFKDLPIPIDLVCFDAGVNCGPSRAARWLQTAINVSVDGVIGTKTIKAVSDADIASVVKSCLDQRRDYYEELCERDPTQYRFLKGWQNRVNRLEGVCNG